MQRVFTRWNQDIAGTPVLHFIVQFKFIPVDQSVEVIEPKLGLDILLISLSRIKVLTG